jgi:hypothetical protein
MDRRLIIVGDKFFLLSLVVKDLLLVGEAFSSTESALLSTFLPAKSRVLTESAALADPQRSLRVCDAKRDHDGSDVPILAVLGEIDGEALGDLTNTEGTDMSEGTPQDAVPVSGLYSTPSSPDGTAVSNATCGLETSGASWTLPCLLFSRALVLELRPAGSSWKALGNAGDEWLRRSDSRRLLSD